MTQRATAPRSLPEKVVTGISVLIVGGLIAYAFGQEAQRRDADPANVNIAFDVGNATYQDGTFYIGYTVTNDSSHAIDSADLLVEVVDDAKVVESTMISVVSLPLDGRQRGIYASRYDPDGHEIRGRLASLVFP